jgi:hypothetical protein
MEIAQSGLDEIRAATHQPKTPWHTARPAKSRGAILIPKAILVYAAP